MLLLGDFFITLLNGTYLNEATKKIRPTMGANRVVAGSTVEQLIGTIECLSAKHIDVTVDNLGEFVNSRTVATQAEDEILEIMETINKYQVSVHMSVKVSSLGDKFDTELAYQNLREILLKANAYDDMHINIDMEKYNSLSQALQILDKLRGEFRNVGTAIQGYLFKAEKLIDKYPESRLRLVKGACKEDDAVVYQSKKDIDRNYINIIEKHLLNAKNFTPIAAHNDNIISHIKQFIKDHHIEKSTSGFQMLYDFRNELAEKVARQGYHFTVYVPYGNNWFTYFMRRLTERSQNLSLAYQEFISTEALKKIGLISRLTLGTLTLISSVMRLLERRNAERLDNP